MKDNYIEEMKRTKEMLESQFAIVSSLVNIYHTVHLINLEANTSSQYVASVNVKAYYDPKLPATEQMVKEIRNLMRDDFIEEALEFTDLLTLPKRMKNQKTISKELVSKYVGWIRATFVTIECSKRGVPSSVLFITQVIEDEKKLVEGLMYQSYNDELTGLYNRRSYEHDLAFSPKIPVEKDLVYVSMDVNGLKTTNDTYGHTAGDELIKGAAKCMKKCFGPYGKLYRVGGDEFVGIIYCSPNQLNKLKKDFEQETLNWHGEVVKTLSVSCGFATKREYPEMPLEGIAAAADKRMYAQKALQYSAKGIDRRVQQLAYNALRNSYMKILKVDIEKDIFTIIQIEKEELEAGIPETYSAMTKDVVKRGMIFEEDVKLFLRKTRALNLKKYFDKGKKSRAFYYRRKIGEEYKFVLMEIVVTQDYSPQNQTVFLYIKQIEE